MTCIVSSTAGASRLAAASRPIAATTAVTASATRQHRRHHGAEGDQQDAQADRDGEQTEPGQAALQFVTDQFVGARVASLGDVEVGVGGLHLADRVEGRLHPLLGGLGVAGDAEGDQRRLAVRGDDRGLHPGHVRGAGERFGDGGDGRGPVGAGPVLHEHQFAGRGHREAGLFDDPVGLFRVAVAQVDVGRLTGAELSTEDDHADDEGDPAEDRERPVAGAP